MKKILHNHIKIKSTDHLFTLSFKKTAGHEDQSVILTEVFIKHTHTHTTVGNLIVCGKPTARAGKDGMEKNGGKDESCIKKCILKSNTSADQLH